MTVYVDYLMDHGAHWGKSCHMFCDTVDLTDLHKVARDIGMPRQWLDAKRPEFPHYDLNARRRGFAIELGVRPLDTRAELIVVYRKVKAMNQAHILERNQA